MYDCPNCGGNLRFDIPKQMLLCDFCGSTMDPYSYEKKKDAVESQVFETTVYTCPQCGGEIMTTNVSATGFCTYCGASTILDSRIRSEKRPAKIIPFKKTKEDCKTAFSAMMRRSLYAPKELKSPDYLEQFRGIYMPYWMYDYRIRGIRRLKGTTSTREGDYTVTRHYLLGCDLDAFYDGVSYDASSSLDDSLSESIAPFDTGEAKKFSPSFLCGFYADTPDVPADVYADDAFSLIANDVIDRASSKIFFDKSVDKPDDPADVLQYDSPAPACALFPVWFLTYRHRDRVAYAVMNGQTGRISTDLPIVEGKYLAGSLILAVPLFFLFNIFLTVTAPTVLLLTAFPAAAAGFAYLAEIRAQLSMEAHEKDKGYQAIHSDISEDPKKEQPAPAGVDRFTASPEWHPEGRGSAVDNSVSAGAGEIPAGSMRKPEKAGGSSSKITGKPTAHNKEKKKNKKKEKKKESGSPIFLFLVAVYLIYMSWSLLDSVILAAGFLMVIVPVVLAILLTVSAVRLQKKHGAEKAGVFPGTAGALAALVLVFIVTILHPVSDLYYYGAGIVSILLTGITLDAVVRRYNLMATRPLPSFFDRKGGDVRG